MSKVPLYFGGQHLCTPLYSQKDHRVETESKLQTSELTPAVKGKQLGGVPGGGGRILGSGGQVLGFEVSFYCLRFDHSGHRRWST